MAIKTNRVIRVIVIVLIAAATSLFLYLMVNNFQFTRGVSVRVHFTSIGDLVTGAWVRKSGIKVGSVTRVEPAVDEKTVIATLTFKPNQIVRKDDRFALVSKGILGDMYIEQNPGSRDSPLAEEGDLFEGAPSFSINDILGGDAMNSVTDLVASIKNIADILKRNEAEVDAIIRDLQKTAENAKLITQDVAEITKNVPGLTAQIVSSMNRLEKTVNNFSDTTDAMVSKLQADLGSSGKDLAASLKTVKNATEGIQLMVDQLSAKGSLIDTLSSPETSRNLSETLKNLDDMSKTLLKATEDTQKIVEEVKTLLAP
jgi:phospholipid/cholesterol/gamma-HCH transport system substrate-binding protein